MRTFILKTFTITFAVFILYKLTIGREIETFSKNVKSLTNQHSRIEIKQKILSEIMFLCIYNVVFIIFFWNRSYAFYMVGCKSIYDITFISCLFWNSN